MLLDEPTNLLDKEHITWLAGYLSNLENAFMVVSHDNTFLERITTRICDIDNGEIRKYYGTYSEFLQKKTLLREDYIRQYSAQQKEKKRQKNLYEEILLDAKQKWQGAGKSNLIEWTK